MAKTWTQRDGSQIPIKNMEDEHIINCLKMVWRKWLILNVKSAAGVDDPNITHADLYDEFRKRHRIDLIDRIDRYSNAIRDAYELEVIHVRSK